MRAARTRARGCVAVLMRPTGFRAALRARVLQTQPAHAARPESREPPWSPAAALPRPHGHGRDDHGQFGLDRVMSPRHPRQEGGKAQAELRDQQREHQNRRAPHGFDPASIRDRARTAVQASTNGDDHGIDHVRPPAHAVMAEHRSQNQLHIQHEDRKQGQREQTGAPRVEFHSRDFFDPAASGEESDRDGNAEESLRHRGVRRGNCRRLK